MGEAKKIIVISREFECDFKKLKEILDACPELSIQDNGSAASKYVQYKSETNKTITVLSEKSCIRSVVESSNVIIYCGNEIDVSQYKDYTPVELVNPIKLNEELKDSITEDNSLKYLLQVLSDLCGVGLMQGFERIIKECKQPDANEASSDKKGEEQEMDGDRDESLQDQKYIICDYGDADIGKSTTLNKVIDILNYSGNAILNRPIIPIPDAKIGKDSDTYAEYVVSGVKIAVCTQGDPKSDQLKYLQKAVSWGARVIVCAARDDRNGVANARTVDNIYDGTSNYIIIWTRNFFISKGDKGNGNNIIEDIMARESADGIIRLIEQLTGVTI